MTDTATTTTATIIKTSMSNDTNLVAMETTTTTTTTTTPTTTTAMATPLTGLLIGDELQKQQLIGRIAKKFDETAAQSQRPITENIMQLSEQLTKEKIAAIKAKKKAVQRRQVTAGVAGAGDLMLDDEINQQLISSSSFSSAAVAASGVKTAASAAQMSSEQLLMNEAIMREITRREIVGKSRFTVLQSAGKNFEKG